VKKYFFILVLSVCVISSAWGLLIFKESPDNSLVVMKIDVLSPLHNNSGIFVIYNIDTREYYGAVNYREKDYCFIPNVPKGRYIVSSVNHDFSTGNMDVGFPLDDSGIITRKIRDKGAAGSLFGGLSGASVKITTNDVKQVFEIKEPGEYYLGRLEVDIGIGIVVGIKYFDQTNPDDEIDIKNIMKKYGWNSESVNFEPAFSKTNFTY
jgi:hypothetical protein